MYSVMSICNEHHVLNVLLKAFTQAYLPSGTILAEGRKI